MPWVLRGSTGRPGVHQGSVGLPELHGTITTNSLVTRSLPRLALDLRSHSLPLVPRLHHIQLLSLDPRWALQSMQHQQNMQLQMMNRANSGGGTNNNNVNVINVNSGGHTHYKPMPSNLFKYCCPVCAVCWYEGCTCNTCGACCCGCCFTLFCWQPIPIPIVGPGGGPDTADADFEGPADVQMVR